MNKLFAFFAKPVFAQTVDRVDIDGKARTFFGYTCITDFIFRAVDVAIIGSGLMLLVYLIWGGVEWLSGAGDKTKTESARNKITGALVGVAVIASAYAIWKLALTFFGINAPGICTNNPIGS